MIQENVPTILQEFVQPRVINQDMLINLVIEQGPKGEAGKLFYEDGINLHETRKIRIEFLNILKIDYLWVMPNLIELKLSNNIIEKIENLDALVNLKELDLSFNRIKTMENLNHLTNLEILLLFNNEISEIENINDLNNLTIFSIGNNIVTDSKHVLYLRKFKKLRSLNINGNPCTKEDGYLDYVFAFIPQLIYYEYKMITNEQRKNAREKHYRTLNTLEEIEMKEKEELDAQEEYKKKLAFLTAAYVEYLDDDYLFHQMFEDDKEGKDLSMVNEDTQNAFEEYKINFSALCKEFCEIGLEEHDKRINETNLYDIAVKEGKSISENQGRMIVNEVLHKKTDISATIKQLIKKLTGNVDAITLENITKEAHQLSEEFNDIITDAWTKLMSIEVDLHEQMEDINEVFRINMSDMMDSFLTIARGYFSQLRNCEAEYNDTINGLILYYLSGFGDDVKLPRHLLNLCEDKDMLNYNLNNSHERHLQIIDAREDTMINRAKNWLEEYNEQLIKYERERNNQQVLEISHFADFQQQEFSQLLQQLNLNTDDSEVILALDE
ncbi:dynein regulatory complex subunit 3-like isoform X1 [Frieseomelitta varia]|uniref:dynein regulatory complex subunit 3-like isoform X1 n=3 Tax=Frieseomelitta varia TaxID=561572 RepID=UPI001CB67EE6|nr:dynein regulatory complex subunit 3-like isoform X1 [Frieseomelitta varia]